MHSSVSQDQELSRRLQLAGAAFHRLQTKVFSLHGVSLTTKLQFYQAIVVPTLLYGAAESWALTAAQTRRLDAFHTTCLRRLLGTRRREGGISNREVYAATGMQPLSNLLRKHRLRWLGHMGRMPDSAGVKQLLFATSTAGRQVSAAGIQRRVVGRPGMAWNRVVQEDLAAVGQAHTERATIGQSWYAACQDRKQWMGITKAAENLNMGRGDEDGA